MICDVEKLPISPRTRSPRKYSMINRPILYANKYHRPTSPWNVFFFSLTSQINTKKSKKSKRGFVKRLIFYLAEMSKSLKPVFPFFISSIISSTASEIKGFPLERGSLLERQVQSEDGSLLHNSILQRNSLIGQTLGLKRRKG